MKVTLVATTQSLVRTEDNSRFLTPEEHIVYCARVSNPNNQLNTETAPKLLQYCMKKNHWSVFEQADLTFEIVTSRDISAQILRHKSFSFQEFSQRYSVVTNLESFNIRKQAEKNRQSSSEILDLTPEDIERIKKHLNESLELYGWILDKGGARECARKVLPLCTQTTMYMKGSVRSWIHYFAVRNNADTQEEHREIAEAALTIFCKMFPAIAESLNFVLNTESPVLEVNKEAEKMKDLVDNSIYRI